jgi:hypothetical protein
MVYHPLIRFRYALQKAAAAAPSAPAAAAAAAKAAVAPAAKAPSASATRLARTATRVEYKDAPARSSIPADEMQVIMVSGRSSFRTHFAPLFLTSCRVPATAANSPR